jgi:hypothetical protein
MTNLIARRALLLGLGRAATFGSVMAALPHLARAAQAAPAQKVCLNMIYPSGEGLGFDADAFRDRHVPKLKQAYGPAVERVELRVAPPPPPAMDGQPQQAAPLLAAVSMWLGDIGEFINRNQASARELAADMATITRSAPMVQFDVLEGQAGEAAGRIIGGSTVVSNYFFAPQDAAAAGQAKWDADYFGRSYLPKLIETYGADAIRRAEVVRGELAQGGGKPLVTGTIHLYVKDPAAYDAALARPEVQALGTEARQHSTLNPVSLLMTVHTTA